MKLIVVLILFSSQCFDIGVVFGAGPNIAKIKCDNYRKRLPKISKVFNENKEDAVPKEFPFMAKVENDTHLRNGILISENFVLTILKDFGLAGKKVVALGSVSTAKVDNENVKYFSVVKEFVHPQYENSSHGIQLLKLNASVKFDDFIQPACLPQPGAKISQELMEIGLAETNVRNTKSLHKVKMSYVSNAECRAKTYLMRNLMEKVDSETIFCASTKKGDRELCGGFGGAALLNNNRDTTTLSEVIGLAVVKNTCGDNDTNPTIFVRLSASLTWIENIVWPNEFTTTTATKKISTTVPFPSNKAQTTADIPMTTSTSNRQNEMQLRTIVFIATISIAMLVVILAISATCWKEKWLMNRQGEININVNFQNSNHA